MAKYPGHIHAVLPGTAGTSARRDSLRTGYFNIGTTWAEYGITASSDYWAMIEPTYNGSGTGPAYFGQTGGWVVYEYKSANGPSIHTFAPGATASFTQYTAAIGASSGITALNQAIDWYNGRTGAFVASNTFKSLPDTSGFLVFALDADQVACVRPTSNFNGVNLTQSRDLSYNKIVYSANGAKPTPAYAGAVASFARPLPWYIDFAGLAETSLSALTSTFLSGQRDATISFWFLIADVNYDFDILTILSGSGGTLAYIDVYFASGLLYVDSLFAGSAQQISFGGLTDSVWYNITITLNGDLAEMELFVDGSLQSTMGISNSWAGWSSPFTNTIIGGSSASSLPAFYLNCLYIWDQDIDLYSQPGTGFSGVEFFYRSSFPEFQ